MRRLRWATSSSPCRRVRSVACAGSRCMAIRRARCLVSVWRSTWLVTVSRRLTVGRWLGWRTAWSDVALYDDVHLPGPRGRQAARARVGRACACDGRHGRVVGRIMLMEARPLWRWARPVPYRCAWTEPLPLRAGDHAVVLSYSAGSRVAGVVRSLMAATSMSPACRREPAARRCDGRRDDQCDRSR